MFFNENSPKVYCQAVPFNPHFELQDPRTSFYEMCSFRYRFSNSNVVGLTFPTNILLLFNFRKMGQKFIKRLFDVQV